MTNDWRDRYRDKLVSPAEAVKSVKSGDIVAINLMHDSLTLGRALAGRRGELRDVRIRHTAASVPYPWFLERMDDAFLYEVGYASAVNREGIVKGWGDYVPWPFGLSWRQFEDDRWGYWTKPNVFITKVSLPNDKGYCCFGHQSWAGPIAKHTAGTIIAEMHPELPHTYGDNWIHMDQIDFLTEPDPADAFSFEMPVPPQDEVDAIQVIGAHAASLVRDGDTFQTGAGSAPLAVLEFLGDKNDLGVYSEFMAHQVVDLEKAGNVTGRFKTHKPGKLLTSSMMVPMADPKVAEAYLRHVEMNERYEFYDIGYMCYVPRIAQQHNMVAINSILAFDLTGQATVDVLGDMPISGVGGNLEFLLGATYSKGGRSVTLLLSTAMGGEASRIVPRHPEGAVISVPRGIFDYVVTEYGIVNLQGKSLRDRAAALISIAHPKFREELRSEAKAMFSGRKVIA